MIRRIVLFTALISPLALAACGGSDSEWQVTHVNQEHTAGGVVAYVRQKMMPEQELKLEPMTADIEAQHSDAVEKMQEMFSQSQKK